MKKNWNKYKRQILFLNKLLEFCSIFYFFVNKKQIGDHLSGKTKMCFLMAQEEGNYPFSAEEHSLKSKKCLTSLLLVSKAKEEKGPLSKDLNNQEIC